MEKEKSKPEIFHSACVEGEFETILQMIESGECSLIRKFRGGYVCLHFAAAHGRVDVVRTLIEKFKCDPNIQGGSYTSLHIACYYGQIDVVKYLVSEQKCLKGRGCSLLRYALLDARIHCPPLRFRPVQDDKHFEIVMFLIRDCSCMLNRQARKKRLSHDNLVHMACQYGTIEDIKCFVAKGLKPNTSLALYFCEYGRLDMLKYAIEKKYCNPKTYTANGNNTLLHIACASGKFDVIKYLVATGYIDPKLSNHDGDNCAHIACSNGYLEVLKCLLEEGKLDPMLDNKMGNTLLHLACVNKHLPIVEYLIVNRGCSPIIKNKKSEFPLHLACQSESLEIARLVSEFSPPKLVEKMITPLHIACLNGSLEIVKYLVNERNWNPQDEDPSGSTTLHYACSYHMHGHIVLHYPPGSTALHYAYSYQGWCFGREVIVNLELIMFLVKECHCDPMKPTHHCSSPIETACRRSDLEKLRILTSLNVNCLDQHMNTPLHLACKHHKIDIVRYLTTERKCDQTIQNSSGELPLHIACQQRSLEMVKLVSDCEINSQAQNDETPLHIACRCEDLEIIRYLTKEKYCDQTIQNSMGELPLHIACQQKSLEMVKLVSDCEINVQAQNGDTPLHIACRHGYEIIDLELESIECSDEAIDLEVESVECKDEAVDLDIAKFLIETKGCSPPQHPKMYSNLSLHAACKSGDLDLVKSIATPENVNYCFQGDVNSEGITPLQVACKHNKPEVVRFLVKEMNADLNIVSDYDQSLALHNACQFNSLEMVQLVSNCVDVNLRDSDGNTPLHVACKNGTLEIVKHLSKVKCCDPTIENNQKELPLHIACQRQSLDMVKLVSNCDPNHRKRRNYSSNLEDTPLHRAFRLGIVGIATYLIENGIFDLSIANNEGELPIHHACKHYLRLVKLTTDYSGQNLTNIATARGATPLHFACQRQSLSMVKLVSNCDPNLRKRRNYSSDLGDTPLHIAFRLGAVDIATYLIESGKCDLSIANDEGELPIHHACKHSLRLVKLTTDYSGQNLTNIATATGATPLHFACLHGKIEEVKYLIEEKGADHNICDKNGLKPLHYACGFSSRSQLNKPSDNEGIVAVSKYLVTECGSDPLDECEGNIDSQWYMAAYQVSPLEKSISVGNLPLIKALMDVNSNRLNSHGDSMLHVACRHEQVAVVKFLIEDQCSNQMIQNRTGELPIHIACKVDSAEIVKLVSSNCEVNMTTVAGETPLHIACKHNHIQAVEHLVMGIQNCSDSSIADNDGILPLHLACKQNSLALVKLVSNCDLNARTKDGETPLHIILKQLPKEHAEMKERTSIIKYLVNEKHSNVNQPDENGKLPLHVACEQISLEVVKLVGNCDVNARTKDGETPLHIILKQLPKKHAEMKERTSIIEYLVNEKHSDVNQPDDNGKLPLHVACEQISLKVVKLVSNCDVNARTKDGNTPLHIILQQSSSSLEGREMRYQIVKHLVTIKGCDLTLANNNNEIPIHKACRQGECELQVVKLLACAESVNIGDRNGDTLLHIACMCKEMEITKFLVETNQSDVNLQNTRGNTPLHLACMGSLYINSGGVVQYLVEGRSNLSIPNNNGEVPLHIVCSLTHEVSLEFIQLLANPSVINSQTQSGDTPLHIACRRVSPHVAMCLLKQAGCNANIQNSAGELPLHIVCQKSEIFNRVIKQLSQKCDLNSTNRSMDTPLHILCRNGNLEMIRLFLNIRHCDANIQNCNGELPLHLACHHNFKIVKLVGAHTAYEFRNATTTSGDTILHVACRNSNSCKEQYSIVKYLVENLQCDPSLQNNKGLLPLHLACCHGSMEMAKLVSGCNPDIQCNDDDEIPVKNSVHCYYHEETCPCIAGDTPLHIACRTGEHELVKFLIEQKHSKVNIPNNDGELPLHIACRNALRDSSTVELVSDCDPNTQTKCGDTPMHNAIHHATMIHKGNYLVQKRHCDINIPNSKGEVPLHIACSMDFCEEALVLLCSTKSINAQNKNGDTPLHIACQKYSGIKFAYYLMKTKECDPTVSNNDGDMPLHIACRNQQLDIVKLVSVSLNINARNSAGNTPLHEVCMQEDHYNIIRREPFELVNYLITEKLCNPSILNNLRELPLHLACRKRWLKTVKLLTAVDNVNSPTLSGNTPLHEACMASADLNQYHTDTMSLKNLLKFLIEEKGCNPHCKNVVGRTPLHYLCESSTDTLAVEYLLSTGKVKVSVADNKGQAPIMLTTSVEITRMLLKHGADATSLYELYHDFFKTKTPPPTPLNVLVVGNPSMGKTTLIESLTNETCDVFQTDQKAHTAGIIPSDFQSKIYGAVIFYDFAGHQEYYASHEAVVHNVIKKSSPVIILLVNIAKDKEDIFKGILSWLSFLENRCTTMKEKPHLIIVGSHADTFKDASTSEDMLKHIITSLQPRFVKSQLNFIASVAMDCRQSQSPGMTTLRQLLKQSSKKLQDTAVMNFTCHCLCVFFQDKLKHVTALPVEQIPNTINMCYAQNDKSKKNKPEAHLPTDTQDIIEICEVLHERGQLILLKDETKPSMSWVILNKETLLSTVSGTIFAPKSFTQYRDMSSSTGVVPFHKIAAYFPDHDPNMIVGFLSYMEFCQEVRDQEVLDLLTPSDRARRAKSLSERYLFFPNLVRIEVPQEVWEPDPECSYQWGWILNCTESDHFFTPRFLQVLILQLAFSFALIPPKVPPSWEEIPAIKRACSVWKKGISWITTAGMEAVVEVVEESQGVIVMVRCRSYRKIVSEAKCIHLRSLLIRKVLQTKQTFCPNVSTEESFVHPQHLKYPLACIRKMNLFSLPIVSQAIIKLQPCAVSNSPGKIINIEDLLRFEPYSDLGKGILQILFNQENGETMVTDDFLYNMAASITENTDDPTNFEFKKKVFTKILNVHNVTYKKDTHDSDIDPKIHELLRIFQAWRSQSSGTVQCLREKLDEFSLFCGRNPLEFYTTCGTQEKVTDDNHCRLLHDDLPSQSNEYKRMLRYYSKIIEYLAKQQCARSLAPKLLTSELISQHVYDLAIETAGPGVVESTRIEPMVKAVLSKVQLDPQIYCKFMENLTEIGGLNEIVDLLQVAGWS